MIILGIDPGVATIGFGLVRAERNRNQLLRYGVITTPPGIPLSNRLLQISNDMEELIHAFHPDEMAVEELFFTKNITTGIENIIKDRLMDGWSFEGYVPVETRGIGDIETLSLIFQKDM